MGTCFSIVKKDKANKFHDLMASPPDQKDKSTVAGIIHVYQRQQLHDPITSFRDHDSKEETFFDSQPWLNSESEDDFVSVNGEFTPSRGSSPRHANLSPKISSLRKTIFDEKSVSFKSEQSLVEKKRRSLVELFRESIRIVDRSDSGEHKENSDQNGIVTNGENKIKENKRNFQRCIPIMFSGRRSIDGNKKMSAAPVLSTY